MGVRSIAFHPDGRTLFAGLEDSLKVQIVCSNNKIIMINNLSRIKISYLMLIYGRCIHGNLLYVMMLLTWDGQRLATYVFMMRSFWVARSTVILLEYGCQIFR